jgi:hypothetical protein
MYEIFFDTLIDAAKMLPLLLAIYIGIELVEYKFGNKIRETVQKAGNAGPAIGALSGSFRNAASLSWRRLYIRKDW